MLQCACLPGTVPKLTLSPGISYSGGGWPCLLKQRVKGVFLMEISILKGHSLLANSEKMGTSISPFPFGKEETITHKKHCLMICSLKPWILQIHPSSIET